jgi:hypothetical protein
LHPQQQYYPPNPSTILRAKTDETGRFRFTGVMAGRHFISALAPGFATPSDNYLGQAEKMLSISDGENIEDVVIELKRGGVITGRVIDAQGRPLNVAPGKYWPVARAVPDDEPSDRPPAPVAWDANERAKLRREAEALKVEIELKPCQRAAEQIVKFAR